jgi:integrase
VDFQRIEAVSSRSSKRPNKPKLKNQKQVDNAIRDSHGNPYHKHPIGRGLYLVTRGGAGFWHLQVWDRARQVRLKDGTLKIGTRTSIGLGRAGGGEGELTRDAAVKLADEKRVQVQKDGTVIRAGGRATVSRMLAGGTGPTFQSLADAFLEAERSKYKDPDEHVRRVNYRRYWAALSDMPWTSIAPSDVAAVLKSEHVIRGEKRVLWEGADKKPGSLVRSLVERILGRAAALAEQQARATGRPIVPYSNPAALDVLQHYDLPKSKNGEKRHHPAIDWRKAPELWSKLASEDSARSRSLRFLMATGVRLEEAMQMTWREIDGDKVWHIPAGRMKGGKAHDVPLSDLAIGLVGAARPTIGCSRAIVCCCGICNRSDIETRTRATALRRFTACGPRSGNGLRTTALPIASPRLCSRTPTRIASKPPTSAALSLSRVGRSCRTGRGS